MKQFFTYYGFSFAALALALVAIGSLHLAYEMGPTALRITGIIYMVLGVLRTVGGGGLPRFRVALAQEEIMAFDEGDGINTRGHYYPPGAAPSEGVVVGERGEAQLLNLALTLLAKALVVVFLWAPLDVLLQSIHLVHAGVVRARGRWLNFRWAFWPSYSGYWSIPVAMFGAFMVLGPLFRDPDSITSDIRRSDRDRIIALFEKNRFFHGTWTIDGQSGPLGPRIVSRGEFRPSVLGTAPLMYFECGFFDPDNGKRWRMYDGTLFFSKNESGKLQVWLEPAARGTVELEAPPGPWVDYFLWQGQRQKLFAEFDGDKTLAEWNGLFQLTATPPRE